jgi:ABC-type dipeptide/oligopeptide/nickel transport system permease component
MILDSIIDGRWDVLGDVLRHIILPSIALAAGGIGQVMRITR